VPQYVLWLTGWKAVLTGPGGPGRPQPWARDVPPQQRQPGGCIKQGQHAQGGLRSCVRLWAPSGRQTGTCWWQSSKEGVWGLEHLSQAEPGSWGCSAWRRERSGRENLRACKYLLFRLKMDPDSSEQCLVEGKVVDTKWNTGIATSGKKNHRECDQALQPDAQKGFGTSLETLRSQLDSVLNSLVQVTWLSAGWLD